MGLFIRETIEKKRLLEQRLGRWLNLTNSCLLRSSACRYKQHKRKMKMSYWETGKSNTKRGGRNYKTIRTQTPSRQNKAHAASVPFYWNTNVWKSQNCCSCPGQRPLHLSMGLSASPTYPSSPAPCTNVNVPQSHALLSTSIAGSRGYIRLPTLCMPPPSSETMEVCLFPQSLRTVPRLDASSHTGHLLLLQPSAQTVRKISVYTLQAVRRWCVLLVYALLKQTHPSTSISVGTFIDTTY